MEKQQLMTDFELFIKKNNLKKKDIAEYLNVSGAFITQLVNGVRNIPREKLALIKAHKQWDSSMLKEVMGTTKIIEKDNSVVSIPREVFDQINKLTEAVLSQQETIKSQQKTIEKLSEKRGTVVDVKDVAKKAIHG